MSLPTYYYRCTACDFSQSSGIYEPDSAQRIYDLGGGAVAPVTTSREWCPHCQQIAQAECPPTQQRITRLLEDDPAEDWFGQGYRTTAQRQERTRAEAIAEGKPPIPISLVEQYVHSEKAWREWAAEHENRPHHCLICSTETYIPEATKPEEVPPLTKPAKYMARLQGASIDEQVQRKWDDVTAGGKYPDPYAETSMQSYWRHPGCGGIMMLHDPQMRVSWRNQRQERVTVIRYDRGGLRLE